MPASAAPVFSRRQARLGAALSLLCACLPQDDLGSYSRAWTGAAPHDPGASGVDAGPLAPLDGGSEPPSASGSGASETPSPSPGTTDAGAAADAGATPDASTLSPADAAAPPGDGSADAAPPP